MNTSHARKSLRTKIVCGGTTVSIPVPKNYPNKTKGRR